MNDLGLATSLALILSLHGLNKRSLSPGGAATAFVVGLLTMAGGLRAFGVALVVLYFVGSRATKHGKERKAKLEDGYVDAGYRSGWQVLCNSIWGVVATTLWNAMHVEGSIHARLYGAFFVGGGWKEYKRDGWCALNGEGSELVYFALGHFACSLGDTLASELGILSRSEPRLVTSLWRKVPPGTNGGMTVWGTACSVMGGGIIGAAMGLSLFMENSACSSSSSSSLSPILRFVLVGLLCGGVGSLIDSVLGATVQRTLYDVGRGKITSQGSGIAVSGFDLLSNNQVNLLSSLLTAYVALLLAPSP